MFNYRVSFKDDSKRTREIVLAVRKYPYNERVKKELLNRGFRGIEIRSVRFISKT